MKTDLKLVESIYDTCSMAIFSIEKLLEKLEDKQNKIIPTLKNIKKGYSRYQKDSEEILEIASITPKNLNLLIKMSTSFNMSLEIIHDNSDSSICEMLIKGIGMGVSEMEKELNEKCQLNEKTVAFTKQFINFQKDNIKCLKSHL